MFIYSICFLLREHTRTKIYKLVECPARCCGFFRELKKTNIIKITYKIKKNINNIIIEYVYLQSRSNDYF
jgi:hypothetical protein